MHKSLHCVKVAITILAFGLMGMSSCNDEEESDSGKPKNDQHTSKPTFDTNALEAGHYELEVSGGSEKELQGAIAVFSAKFSSFPNADTGIMMILEDSAGTHRVQVKLKKNGPGRIDEGRYPVTSNRLSELSPQQKSNVNYFPDNGRSNLQSTDGNSALQITERTDTSLRGNFPGIKLTHPTNEKSVTLTGQFHAEAEWEGGRITS